MVLPLALEGGAIISLIKPWVKNRRYNLLGFDSFKGVVTGARPGREEKKGTKRGLRDSRCKQDEDAVVARQGDYGGECGIGSILCFL